MFLLWFPNIRMMMEGMKGVAMAVKRELVLTPQLVPRQQTWACLVVAASHQAVQGLVLLPL
jgi:hypothetical protein